MGYAYPIDSKVVTNPNGTVDYDRASSSAQLRGLIKSMITNGVNLTESTNLQVMAEGETMNVVVKPGYVIIEGALKYFEEDVKVKIANADASYPRIDTVVVSTQHTDDVDLAVLRVAIYEIKHREDIPVGVSINEAVEIGKKFGTDKSGAFINGLLAQV